MKQTTINWPLRRVTTERDNVARLINHALHFDVDEAGVRNHKRLSRRIEHITKVERALIRKHAAKVEEAAGVFRVATDSDGNQLWKTDVSKKAYEKERREYLDTEVDIRVCTVDGALVDQGRERPPGILKRACEWMFDPVPWDDEDDEGEDLFIPEGLDTFLDDDEDDDPKPTPPSNGKATASKPRSG